MIINVCMIPIASHRCYINTYRFSGFSYNKLMKIFTQESKRHKINILIKLLSKKNILIK